MASACLPAHQDGSAIEVAPGKIGPQADALAEIARRRDRVAQFLLAHSVLHRGPVIAGIEPDRLIPARRWLARNPRGYSSAPGGCQQVMIACGGGRSLLGPAPGLLRLLVFLEQSQVVGTVFPESTQVGGRPVMASARSSNWSTCRTTSACPCACRTRPASSK